MTWDELLHGPCFVCGIAPSEFTTQPYLGNEFRFLGHLHFDHGLWPNVDIAPCCGFESGAWTSDLKHLRSNHSPEEFQKCIVLLALGGPRW